MNFTINQTNGIRETVNSEFINKLYNLFITNRSSHTISLSGYLYSPTGYKAQMDALNQQYGPDLVIEVPEAGQYILIEDPAVLQILINNNISSDGIGISALDASTANLTASMFKNNTNITSFNQFKYFTKANNNPVNELFRGCTNLESVDLSGVIRISTQEFQSSGIKNINAPSLQSLGENAFSYSKVENILDLGQVIEIPQGCFSDCPNLISAVIPETVTSLGGGAFNAYNTSYNKVFTTITGLNNVKNFGVKCFCSQKSLNLNGSDINSAVSIKSEAFSNVRLFSGDLNLKNLQVLEHDAFRNTKISKILCLGKIASIPGYAFVSDTSYDFKSSLTEVYLPYECSSIGDLAFYYRTGLTTLKQYTQSVDNWVEGETPTYGDITRVTSFGNSCFNNCSLLQLSTSAIANATTIGNNAFENCTSLTGSLNLPNLTSFGQAAFKNCTGITSVNDLGSITGLPRDAFYHCSNLASIVLPSTCTSIGQYAFENDIALTNIDLSDVTIIQNYAFVGCTNLTGALSLPSLTTLGEFAFQNCTSITSIANLGNINTIPVNCFRDCSNLTSVIFPTTIRTFNHNCFRGCKIGQIILPYGYIGNSGWTAVMNSSVGENCRYLQYPSTIQVVGTNDMFRDSSSNAINCLIVVQATTPPTTGYDPGNTGALGNGFNWGRPNMASWYVPDSVVNDYKSATGWSQFANKIYPISQLEIDSPTYWQVYQANKDYGVPQNNS